MVRIYHFVKDYSIRHFVKGLADFYSIPLNYKANSSIKEGSKVGLAWPIWNNCILTPVNFSLAIQMLINMLPDNLVQERCQTIVNWLKFLGNLCWIQKQMIFLNDLLNLGKRIWMHSFAQCLQRKKKLFSNNVLLRVHSISSESLTKVSIFYIIFRFKSWKLQINLRWWWYWCWWRWWLCNKRLNSFTYLVVKL